MILPSDLQSGTADQDQNLDSVAEFHIGNKNSCGDLRPKTGTDWASARRVEKILRGKKKGMASNPKEGTEKL